MSEQRQLSPQEKRLSSITSFLDFKKRQNYLDLPNENYSRSPFLAVIQSIAKINFLISFFGCLWGCVFFFWNMQNYYVFSVFVFVLIMIFAGLFDQVVKEKMSEFTFFFIAMFMLFGLSFWFFEIQF